MFDSISCLSCHDNNVYSLSCITITTVTAILLVLSNSSIIFFEYYDDT